MGLQITFGMEDQTPFYEVLVGDVDIYVGSVNRDHVYMLIGILPYFSASRAVQNLKGKSSHKLLSEYGCLRK